MKRHNWIGTAILLVAILGTAGSLAAWKHSSIEANNAAAAGQSAPVERVTADVSKRAEYRPSASSIGTVLALRSISLRNELPGTVRKVSLTPGQRVEAGTVLVALDVSVEQAELQALQAEANLAESVLKRMQQLRDRSVVSQQDLERATAERDVALANIARTRAIIDRKTIRAPFRAQVGMADIHPGQYLEEGTLLTTLQGIDDATHVDFAVEQGIAAGLQVGDSVEISEGNRGHAITASIVAIDARIDPNTRNAMVRARVENAQAVLAPGASVRVSVAAGPLQELVSVAASAIRKGPEGDHVFVLTMEENGTARAISRPVEVITMHDDLAIITRGLITGELVAASGSFKLREQALVAVTTNTGTSAGAAR